MMDQETAYISHSDIKTMDETQYDLKEVQCKPLLSENAKSKDIYDDFLQLSYSLGWHCTTGTNICILDEENIVFGAGTSIIVLKLSTGQQIILPTVCGNGIAHIVLHPDRIMFAIAEKGHNGTIDIFTYPSLNLIKLLKGSDRSSYVCIDYSPSGNLLAALTSAPEFCVAVWHWETETIILKAKAFSQDVKNVKFSKFVDRILITSGAGHIKFWSISRTFTGLKLKGNIGKFGHVDISDIRSFVQLPDGKVISSSDWGNLLVWDDNIIQIQITRIGGKPCHEGIIYQISLEESELYTVGSDGWIRVWDIESIEMIYPEEEQEICEIKPLGEVHVNPGADLRCIFFSQNQLNKKLWYAQDAKGAIWKIDLSLDITAKPPEVIKTFPGLKITGCVMSPASHILAISSKDCIIRIYNCLDNSLVMSSQYDAPITSLLWASKALDKDGGSLFLGFEDGVVRWTVVKSGKKATSRKHILLHRAVKSHNAEVTCMKFNNIATYLVSCSLDGKVFFYYTRGGDMKPIGFVDVLHPIEWVLWLDKVDLILVGGNSYFLAAVEVTKNTAAKRGMTTYKLTDLYWCNITLTTMSFYENMIAKMSIVKKSINETKDSEIDELEDTFEVEENYTISEKNSYESESNSEESKSGSEFENEQREASVTKQSIEDIDNRKYTMEETNETIIDEAFNITYALYTGISGKFWLCLENNPGIIYEYNLTKDMISENTITLYAYRQIELPAPNSNVITCMQFTLYNYYLLVGQSDGILTVYALDKHDTGIQFSEFFSHRILDSEIGAITHLSISFDGKFLVVGSSDGNVLLFTINAPKYEFNEKILKRITLPSSNFMTTTQDVDGKGESLEDTCKAALEIQLKKNLEKRRHHLANQITLLRSKLGKLNEANTTLPSHMQVNLDKYAVHDKLKEKLSDEMKISVEKIRERFECDVKYNNVLLEKLKKKYKESIATVFFVVTSILSEEQVHSYKIVDFPIESYIEVDYSDIETYKQLELESRSKQEDSMTLDMFDTLSLFTSNDLMQIGVDPGKMTDNEILETLEKYIGDYKLKTSSQYHPPIYVPLQSELKQLQLLHLSLCMYQIKKNFNNKFSEIQQYKEQLLKTLSNISALTTIESEIITLNNNSRNKLAKIQTSLHSHVCNLGLSVCPWQVDTRFAAPVVTECLPETVSRPSFVVTTAHSWKISKRILSFPRKESFPPSSESRRVESPMQQSFKHVLQLSGKLNMISKIRDGYREENLHYEMLRYIWAFDIQLHFLKLYRYCTEVELKQAELKRLIFLQELEIFRKYDVERNHLLAHCNTKSKQKTEIEAKAEKQLDIVTHLQNFLDTLYAEEEIIHSALPKILGENNRNAKLLTKFFKKKVKWREIEKYSRNSTYSDSQEHDDEEEEVESDTSSDEDDGYDYSRDWDCKTCPEDCDYETFEAVSKLRQNRSFIEYKIKEINQLIETHKKVHSILENKSKLIEESVAPLQNRLEGIQLMKQKELNGIFHDVHLQLHQIIHCMPPMPAKLDRCVIFLSEKKDVLVKRLETLSKQTNQTTQVSKYVQARETELRKQCCLLNKNVQNLKEIAKLRMIEKFGQVVDLEELKNVENPVWFEELKNKQAQQTWTYEKEMRKSRRKIAQREKIYMEVMKERAINLQTLTALKAEWLNLHTSLSKRKAFTFQAKNL